MPESTPYAVPRAITRRSLAARRQHPVPIVHGVPMSKSRPSVHRANAPPTRTMRPMKRLALAVLALSLVGCQERVTAQSGVFEEHEFQADAAATLALGTDCSKTGGKGCLSGICLHHRPEKDRGWTCSIACTSARECPESWECASILAGLPESSDRFCIPPTSWQAQPTTARPSSSSR